MRYRTSLIVFLAAFILQSTVMNHFRVFGMSPNLILCLVVIFSFLYEGYHGYVHGIAFGFLSDICFAPVIGVASVSNFAVALICVGLKRYLYKDSRISILIVSILGTVVYALLYWSIYRMLGFRADFLYVMKKEVVLLFYHILVALILYQIVIRDVIRHRNDRYMYRGNLQEARSLNRQ